MTLYLADVSEFQDVTWPVYGAANPAVIVRVHNGYRVDNKAAVNVAGARQFCRWRNWYQYLPASVDPVQAAQLFVQALLSWGGIQPGECVTLDLEEGTGDQTGRAAAWHGAVRAAMPATSAWLYSGAAFARAHLGDQVDWIASYGSAEPTDPHLLWQFSDTSAFAGIASVCDGSMWHGDINSLIAATSGAAPTSTAPALASTYPASKGNAMRIVTDIVNGVPAGQYLETENGTTHLQTFEEVQVMSAYIANLNGDPTQGDELNQRQLDVAATVLGRIRAGQ